MYWARVEVLGWGSDQLYRAQSRPLPTGRHSGGRGCPLGRAATGRMIDPGPVASSFPPGPPCGVGQQGGTLQSGWTGLPCRLPEHSKTLLSLARVFEKSAARLATMRSRRNRCLMLTLGAQGLQRSQITHRRSDQGETKPPQGNMKKPPCPSCWLAAALLPSPCHSAGPNGPSPAHKAPRLSTRKRTGQNPGATSNWQPQSVALLSALLLLVWLGVYVVSNGRRNPGGQRRELREVCRDCLRWCYLVVGNRMDLTSMARWWRADHSQSTVNFLSKRPNATEQQQLSKPTA